MTFLHQGIRPFVCGVVFGWIVTALSPGDPLGIWIYDNVTVPLWARLDKEASDA